MPLRFRLLALLLAALALPAAADIVDSKTERQLSLANSNARIAIPREDWLLTREQTRADGRSVYYALASAKRDMTMWVFFDQTPVCQSATSCLELALKNNAYDSAKDMKFADQAPFKVAQFTLAPPQGGAAQQHLIAAAYLDGSWVDLHLIQPAREGAAAGALLDFLKLVSAK
jgi:hypothetical protein